MAVTEADTVVRLGDSDAAAGLVLSTETHWNQTEADWRFFVRRGLTFGVREDGELVATAALLPHNATDAWISMVLVTQRCRRRGLATRLVDRCVAEADRLKLTTWLDATPAGATVYEPLGFSGVLELRRLRLTQRPPLAEAAALGAGKLSDMIAHDRGALGFDRTALLTELSARDGSRLLELNGAISLVRDGRVARHIGPLYAPDLSSALTLIDVIVASETGPVLLDAVAGSSGFVDALQQRGWAVERPFLRMRHGAGTTAPGELPFAVAGPEYG
ncbi:GNAT family N-acetyltransferase [Rhodopseudomonas sp. HC1]|uniref:GNAT family N-acetyltransferase n=1 Tax=Rhodopseudomonas infernalis TaxID=2897386 RepID=UPI001EE90967|nr:GNAT family N-acetyltransferase [Rhodopseudomonas infernalis]MCG6205537.1 GNAT family N-acetyltransferase [Rhodopseudomonas infernalis]